ncbi:molybdopterin molybdotransferase MoeA [Bacillus benzoevorans]|uniref:Molybdopterin molybdenumtransferase n=1 Tax=Bacillus benzoevorans TaxID=1456 RepID=A0A7X0LUZ1_9BACI|nr:gephyrin-like molybdotransferase Glp [Bacillus benzoevorans]MBB6444970.1 molybdopterin molybdotransferase [Bacillus benzoevorans]
MLEKRTPLQINQAVEKVTAHLLAGRTEEVSIFESDGRYLGEDIIATNDVPLFTRSGYDGYALRSIDTVHASSEEPVELRVLEEIGAGMVAAHDIGPFETIRIMTGAKVPNGCDTVIMLEAVKEVEKNGERYITIKREVKKGDHLSYQGEEAKKGDVMLKKGTKINPGVMAVLATFGYAKVRVAVKPRVGIFVTGSELLEVDEPLQDGKIRNSNAHMIFGQVKRVGGEPVYLGKLADELDSCIAAVAEALKEFDLLITTGGVSVGDYDLMPDVYKALNGEVLFNKIAMRPGSVTTVAVLDGKFLFGLSGNPSASYVGFELFVRPVVRNMLFCENLHLKAETARLHVDYKRPNPMTRFVRSKLSFDNGELVVESAGMDKSNVVTSLAHTDVLAVLPGGERGFAIGDKVKVLLLEDDEGSKWPW